MAEFDIGKFADKLASNFPSIINFAADIIVLDIIRGINTSKDIRNKPFKSLKPATIKQKQRLGVSHPNRPLERTGAMKAVYVKSRATRKKLRAIVTMPNRAEYGIYPNRPGRYERFWFGVSPRAEKIFDTKLKQWWEGL